MTLGSVVRLAPLVLVAIPGWTGAEDLRHHASFERIDSNAGLSHNSLYTIAEDHQGFLWIGTVDGLNRYDGYEVVVYRHDLEERFSIRSNVVYAVLEDRAKKLWVGTEDGLSRFDRATERFLPYRLTNPGAPDGVEPTVTTIFEARNGELWILTTENVFV